MACQNNKGKFSPKSNNIILEKAMPAETCPCCSDKPFAKCCEPIINGTSNPKTVKQLMRARFTAYRLGGHGQFLFNTWHPNYCQGLTPTSLSGKTHDWQSLDILQSSQQGDKGGVEFVAHYLDSSGQMHRHHEVSVFVRIKGRWFYTEGKVKITPVPAA